MAQIKNKPKILIIEDEKFISKAYQVGLAHEGFKTIAAYDGKEGLAMAKKEKPDLILLDIIMPVMDGLTMLKELRGQEWGKDMKVLVLTNSNDQAKTSESAHLNAIDFLLKSEWSIELLTKKINEILNIKD
ncbi:response regulator [Patescibacteria group bacterium]|nr:MAG: response regulator [Patescibacteria group bacterium]